MWRSTPSGHQQALFWAWRPYPRAQDRGVKAAPFLSKSSALITKRPVILVSFRPRSQNPSVRFRLVQEIPWHGAAPGRNDANAPSMSTASPKAMGISHRHKTTRHASLKLALSPGPLAFVTYLIIWLSCWQCDFIADVLSLLDW